MKASKKFIQYAMGIACLGLLTQAWAVPYTFYNLTGNTSTDLSSQLSVDVTDAGYGKVLFTFRNNVEINSSITDVYFDDGTLLGISNIYTSSGASYARNAIGFETTAGFSADSNPPVLANGVNASSEYLGIEFKLINGKTFDDLIAALDSGTDLRIGIHAQGIAPYGKSDSYVNVVSGTPVPDSGSTLIALGLGFLMLEGIRRRIRTSEA